MKIWTLCAAGAALLISTYTVGSEKAELSQPVTFCEKRSTASAAVLAVNNFLQKGVSQADIDKGLGDVGCFYMNKSADLVVHRKTKEEKNGIVFHFAEVSIMKIGSKELADNFKAMKFWIAGFELESAGMIKLNDGTYW